MPSTNWSQSLINSTNIGQVSEYDYNETDDYNGTTLSAGDTNLSYNGIDQQPPFSTNFSQTSTNSTNWS